MGKLDADKTQTNEHQEQAKEDLVNYLVVIAIVIGAVVVLVYLFNFEGHVISTTPADWGALGDYLGGVLNPIFAFFAFVILVVSLKVQTKELKATTNEMRNANKAQDRLLQQQNQANQLQSFENLFFQMLTMKNRFINELTLPGTLTSLVRDNVHPEYETDRTFLEDFELQHEDLNKNLATFIYIQDKFITSQVTNNPHVLMLKRHIDGFLLYEHESTSLDKLRDMCQRGLVQIQNLPGGGYYQLSFTDTWWDAFHKDFEDLKQKIAFTNSEIIRLSDQIPFLDTRRQQVIEQLENSNNLPAFMKMQLTLDIYEEFEPDSWAEYMKKGLLESYFGFFNVNYQLLMLIDESQVLDVLGLKRKYFEIYHAQLSNDELKLLFWNTKDSKRFDYLKVFNEFYAFENMYWSDPRHKYQYHVLAEDWERYRAEHH